jgi:hypothetical protein
MFYAGFFAYSNHAVQCVYKEAIGIDCVTCGLTRGFHHILAGEFKKTYQLNPLSLQLFLFFAIELIIRFSLIGIPAVKNNTMKLVKWDIIISVILFVFCFFPLLKQLFK